MLANDLQKLREAALNSQLRRRSEQNLAPSESEKESPRSDVYKIEFLKIQDSEDTILERLNV